MLRGSCLCQGVAFEIDGRVIDQNPKVFGLALGVLDDDPIERPICHVYVGSKAPWHEITDRLPQFDELPTGPVAPRADG